MTRRMVAALATGLFLSGSTFADGPADQPVRPPTTTTAPAPVTQPDSSWNGTVMVSSPLPTGFWSPQASPANETFWINADYLLGFVRPNNLPPLVTTSPSGTPLSAAGVYQSSTTTVLYGNSKVNGGARSGFDLGGGAWLNTEHTIGVEAGFSMLESQANFFNASSNGSTILARPYNNALTGAPDSVVIAFPGSTIGSGAGSISIRVESDNYYESHLDLVGNIWDAGWIRFDSLLGYRFYRYDEGLRIRQTQSPNNPSFVAGTQVTSEDDFNTHNTFNGADFGIRTQIDMGNLSLGLLTKLAVGDIYRQTNILGSTTTTVPGVATSTLPGGIYALSSNLGQQKSASYAMMPEFGADLTWRFTPNISARIGYSILCLNRVARAADQIDNTLNPSLFPPALAGATPLSPTFSNSRADVWIQTINFGVEWDF
jgi:hypothetical protein